MNRQPETITLYQDLCDLIEVVDLGETLLLIQRDDKGNADSVALGNEQCEALRKILEGRR